MTQDTTPTSGAADLPKALRLAAAISNLLCSNEAAARTLAAAADELVRLHAESEMRRAALLDEMQKAALAARQATAAQVVVQDDLITLRKPTTSAEMLWLLKLAHLVISDVGKTLEETFAPAQPAAQQGAADGFFLLLPQRPKPEAPAGTVGLDWDAYSGAQMLAFGRDCSDAAIAALRTEQPAPATEEEEDEGVSREQWVEQAMRVYLIAGDTEDEARECAEYQWGELDMDDLADPYDTAMSDIEGRGPAPATQQAEVEDCRRCHGSGEDPEGYYDQSRGDAGETCDGPCRDCDGTGIAQPSPAAQAAEIVPAPPPPPECETEAEKLAFAFGWFKALESARMKAESVQEDAARESEYRRGYRHGYEQRDAEVREQLTPERVKEIVLGAGYDQRGIPDTEREAFINGLRHGEQAHGIKGGQHGTDT